MLNYTGQKLNSKIQRARNFVGTARILTVDSFMTSFPSDVRFCIKFLLGLIAGVLIYVVCMYLKISDKCIFSKLHFKNFRGVSVSYNETHHRKWSLLANKVLF